MISLTIVYLYLACMKNTVLFKAFLLLLSLFVSIHCGAQTCMPVKKLARELLSAMEKHDTVKYNSLRDDSLYLKTVKSDPALTDDLPYVLAAFEKRAYYHNTMFKDLYQAVLKASGAGKLKLKLADVKILDVFPGGYLIKACNTEISFKANGKIMSIIVVVSEINHCHYLFEPVMADVYIKEKKQ